MIKLYNHWIKFNETRTDKDRGFWVAKRELAEENLKEDLRLIRSDVCEYGISEKDFYETFVLQGELGDNGESYEAFEMMVGDKILYNELYEKFRGNNIRLTVEILKP